MFGVHSQMEWFTEIFGTHLHDFCQKTVAYMELTKNIDYKSKIVAPRATFL